MSQVLGGNINIGGLVGQTDLLEQGNDANRILRARGVVLQIAGAMEEGGG